MTRHRTFIILAAIFAVSACSDRSATAPVEDLAQTPEVGKSATTPNDSTPTPVVATFNLSGKVLGLTRTTAATGADTLRHDPIAGIPLRIMRNLLVNGQATQVLAGETTSGANGDYRVTGLTGGYYVVYATPPASSPWIGNHALVAGTSNEVIAHVYLGRKQ